MRANRAVTVRLQPYFGFHWWMAPDFVETEVFEKRAFEQMTALNEGHFASTILWLVLCGLLTQTNIAILLACYGVGFGPPARNRKKHLEKGLPRKIAGRKKAKIWENWLKNGLLGPFSYFRLSFPYFPGEVSGGRNLSETYSASVADQRDCKTNTQEIRGNSDSGRKFKIFGERSFCNFSALLECVIVTPITICRGTSMASNSVQQRLIGAALPIIWRVFSVLPDRNCKEVCWIKPPFREKLKGRLLKGSFDERVRIDLLAPLPVPTPSPFSSCPTSKPPPTTHLNPTSNPSPRDTNNNSIGTCTPLRKIPS